MKSALVVQVAVFQLILNNPIRIFVHFLEKWKARHKLRCTVEEYPSERLELSRSASLIIYKLAVAVGLAWGAHGELVATQ
jgi:hypothetical protein